MPIKGFNSIEEQSIEKIQEMYGYISKRKNKKHKIIPNDKKIPYICDFTGKEYSMVWRSLRKSINRPKSILRICTERLDNLRCDDNSNLYHGYNKNESYFTFFTDDEITFIKENYCKLGPTIIAKKINKSLNSIWYQAKKFNLTESEVLNNLPIGFAKCYVCGQLLPTEKFCRVKRLCNNNCEKRCKNCKNKLVKETRRKHKKLIFEQDDLKKNFLAKKIFNSIKYKAKKLKLDFDLSVDFLASIIPDKCPIFGFNLIFNTNKSNKDYAPSIDRIDNTKGYIKENIQIISNRANRIKSDATVDELKKIALYIENITNKISKFV